MIRLLEDRFYSGFRQWFWRAGTILGRRLVAQVVILPRLWHFTTQLTSANLL